MAQTNGQGGGLQRVHERLHATHAPNPDAETQPGGDQTLPEGSVRIEEGRFRNPDGSVDAERRSWKVYQLREVSQQEAEAYRAQVAVAGWEVGTMTIQRKWYYVQQCDTEEEALAVANNL